MIQQYISIFPKSHLHHELTIFSRDESFFPYATKLQQTTHEIDEFYQTISYRFIKRRYQTALHYIETKKVKKNYDTNYYF